MKEDIEILRNIFHREGYTPEFTNIILNKIQETDREFLTPHSVYTLLTYDLGKSASKEIADYFDEYKKTGDFRTNLQKMLDRSPWMK